MDKPFDVFGVGNAIVDMLAFVPDQFVADKELQRGSMTLMDPQRQAGILQDLADHKVELASGGSAANTMVGIAQSGGTGIYCGKVAADTNGEFYKQDMEQSGIKFDVEMAPSSSEPTGTCVVLTTPDTERTMCTHLGVSTSLSRSDINVEQMAQCKFSYIEGYLWDAEGPRAACIEAFEQSKKLGLTTSFTFSDSFLIERYTDEFRDLVMKYCDVLFCNADEARRMCEAESLHEAAAKLGESCDLVFVTNGPKGCIVVKDRQSTDVEGFEVDAIDTVGAGDAFAGGVLYGLTHELDVVQAAKWGNFLASQVVSISGPRLGNSQAEKVAELVGA